MFSVNEMNQFEPTEEIKGKMVGQIGFIKSSKDVFVGLDII